MLPTDESANQTLRNGADVPGEKPFIVTHHHGKLEDAVPDSFFPLAKKALNLLGMSQRDLWRRGALGDVCEIVRMRLLSVYSVRRIVVTENRSVEDEFRPYRNERLPKQSVFTPNEVKPSEYRFFDQDQDEGEETAEVQGSAREVTCHDCKKGKATCPECGGSGGDVCSICSGTGRRDCPECGGDGWVFGERSAKKNCPRCRGAKTVKCDLCKAGRDACIYCGGEGQRECPTCGGRGKAIQILCVKARRRRIVQEEELAHPDLVPLVDVMKLEGVTVVRSGPEPEPSPEWADVQALVESLDDEELAAAYEESIGGGWASAEYFRADPEGRARAVVLLTGARCMEGLERWKQRKSHLSSAQDADRSNSEAASRALHAALCAGLPAPRFGRGVTPVRHRFLSHRSELWDPDSGLNQGSQVEGRRFFSGRGPLPAIELSDDLSPEIVGSVERLSRPLPLQERHGLVRDYLEIKSCTWLAVDYTFEGKNYRLFHPKMGIIAPSGSPIAHEPDHILGELVATAAQRGSRKKFLDGLRSAISQLPEYGPSPDKLAEFLTRMSSLPIGRKVKHQVLAVVAGSMTREETLMDLLYPYDFQRVTPALIQAVSRRVDRPRRIAKVLTVLVLLLGLAGAGFFGLKESGLLSTLFATRPTKQSEAGNAIAPPSEKAAGIPAAPNAEEPVTKTPQGSPETVGTASPAPAPVALAIAPITQEEASSLLQTWVKAQNGGDFVTYAGLYAPTFVGVKRSGSSTSTLEYKDWLEDRKKMFGAKAKVVAEEPRFVANGDTMTISFTQDWASPRYRDKGGKKIVLKRVAGNLLIVEEVMETVKVLRRRSD